MATTAHQLIAGLRTKRDTMLRSVEQGSIVALVPPHGARLFRLTARSS